MAAGAQALPQPPGDSNYAGPGPQSQPSDPRSSGSPFGGGAPALMTAMKQIELGYQMLAQQLPSLAPLVADAITKLRMAIPNAVGAGAGQQAGKGPQAPNPGMQTSPSPPSQGQ